MYIKGIKAQGFKSFADKMELDFSNGINAIVGPNGSGKSNVVDAILWVLGEQSIKTLRGESGMTDVIFSGSKTREEAKKASVSILFDNSDHALNTDFNEVEIKRVIYKTGETEYYINNAHVRLKDISDLLIDVTSKFNIISQGNINALVENKSSERRILFESAAGVLKYKKRKEEALRKLEGTKENLTRVNLIIKELNTTLEPLAKQKDEALRFLDLKRDLEAIEIALITSDITDLTNHYEQLKQDNTLLQKKLSVMNIIHPMGIEKKKLENLKLEETINNLNKKLIELTNSLSSLTSEKQIIMERAKYNLDKDTINTNLVSLKEEKLNLDKDLNILEKKLEGLKNEVITLNNEKNELSDESLKLKVKITNENNTINELNKNIFTLENKIKLEKENNENNLYLPRSVSSIINNPKLKGIHNVISALIKYNDEYDTAITTALGASANFLVVDDQNSAKKAIEYLKENRLGRATFFPISVIKSRYLNNDLVNKLKDKDGFMGIASDLVKYDKKYQDIIENQLGNVIIMDNIDHMFKLANELNNSYKMVTLTGEVTFPGGSIAGGEVASSSRSLITKLTKQLKDVQTSLEAENIALASDNEKYSSIDKEIEDINHKISEKRFIISMEEDNKEKLKVKINEIGSNITSLEDVSNNKLNDSLDKLLKDIANKEKEKQLCEDDITEYQSKKFDLNNEINSLEKQMHDQNASYRELENKINANEVEIGKYEVKIDNLITELASDYSLTYENAVGKYNLTMDHEKARTTVNKLKMDLKGLDNVNTGSIAEYDRLKKRYDFLDKQRNDLEASSQELLSIIEDMDEIMKEKFKSTFDSIATEFSKVFRVMFKGGNGLLKLTDENDLLNTGIDILAVPPGKKLNSTTFLSGGEKALTAICLIFAILNVKPAPFIVLDEAEAPLDEENVSMFGEYLKNMKDTSQFILITHKKKMMEYADNLYGITMQESGVSTRVSVKLEDY